MQENKPTIPLNSFRAWILAARPKTLSGALVPVLIGGALAYHHQPHSFTVIPFLLCLLFALIMQVNANFINDYFDFVKGNDDEQRLGPLRACSQGWISASAMKKALVITTVLACIVGLPLLFYGGWWLVAVGLLCVVFCFLYTTSLSYIAMGDVLVLVFFGIVPVYLTFHLSSAATSFHLPVFLASLSCGFVIDTLLVVNNYRDINNDARVGKRTLVVCLGAKLSETFYLALGLVAVTITLSFFLFNYFYAALLPLGYLLFHFRTYQQMCQIAKGKALNKVLGLTARNMLLYGILLSVGILLDTF